MNSNLLTNIQEINIYFLIVNFIVGLPIGILVNYLADVLPVTRCFSRPVCTECKQAYPLKEYLFFQRCPNCKNKHSTRHILVLISTLIICGLLQFFPFYNLSFWASLPLLVYLGVIIVIDFEHRLVLIETSLFGFVLCLGYGIFFHGFLGALSGALGGLLIMLGFFFLGNVFGKVVGKLRHKAIDEVPFGFGDVLIGTILGLLTGWPVIAGAILLGILIFGAYSVVWLISLILTRRYQAFTNAQALTPFLILGTIILFYL